MAIRYLVRVLWEFRPVNLNFDNKVVSISKYRWHKLFSPTRTLQVFSLKTWLIIFNFNLLIWAMIYGKYFSFDLNQGNLSFSHSNSSNLMLFFYEDQLCNVRNHPPWPPTVLWAGLRRGAGSWWAGWAGWAFAQTGFGRIYKRTQTENILIFAHLEFCCFRRLWC